MGGVIFFVVTLAPQEVIQAKFLRSYCWKLRGTSDVATQEHPC